jgi:Flp pilus assembly protein TadD
MFGRSRRFIRRCKTANRWSMIAGMIRSLALAWVLCLALSSTARAQTPDERYIGIYHLIQEADALNDAGKVREAVSRYVEAQNALKDFQSSHPSWNERIVKFRLDYIAARLEPLARKTDGTNAMPAVAATTNVAPGISLTNQLDELQAEIKRLTGQNALLEAKLKEALSVQPPAMDARELAKAEQKINELTKERDLLKVALEQQKGTAMKLSDTAAIDAERKLLVEVQRRLEEQTKENAALRKETEALRRQLAETKPQLEMPVGERNELAGQLQIARATITSLQSSNMALLNQQITLQQQLAEARKAPAHGAAMPADLQKELQLAQARLAIYEGRQTPYSTQELALLKQPDAKASIALASTNAPAKRTRELPAGAGPLMAEAQRAMDAGRFEEAEKKLRDILRQDEKNPYVLGTLAAAQMEQNRHNEAEATIKEALASDPSDPASLLMMGLLKYQQGQYDAALDSLSLSAKGAPDDYRAQYFLGKTLLQKGMRTQAETALRKAISLRPGWGEAHFSLAMAYATQQPPFKELAQWHYQKAIAGGYPRNQEFERMVNEKKPAPIQ